MSPLLPLGRILPLPLPSLGMLDELVLIVQPLSIGGLVTTGFFNVSLTTAGDMFAGVLFATCVDPGSCNYDPWQAGCPLTHC